MATSNTTNLNLIKESNTEPIVNHRGHFNDNMDLIDAAYNTLASRSRGQQTWGNLKQNTTWGELIGTNVVAATTTTDNLELIQPGYDSTVDVESFNDNMSILDSTIGAIDVTNDGSIADQLSSVQDSLNCVSFKGNCKTVTFNTWNGGFSIELFDADRLNGYVAWANEASGYRLYKTVDGTATQVWPTQYSLDRVNGSLIWTDSDDIRAFNFFEHNGNLYLDFRFGTDELNYRRIMLTNTSIQYVTNTPSGGTVNWTKQYSLGKWTFRGNANAFDATKSTSSSGAVYTDYDIISDTLGVSTFRIWRDGRVQFFDNGSQISLRFT